MTNEPAHGKAAAVTDQTARHPFGPRPIGALVPGITRPAFRKHSAAGAQFIADWPAIVGPALASTTRPRRFAAGTLTIDCSGPVAMELQHLVTPLIDRINAHLGRPTVTRLRFVQGSLPVDPPKLASKPRGAPIHIENMPDGPLREALSALGALVRRDPA
jgi:hypothetical protein